MPNSTSGYELFHAGSQSLKRDLEKGRRPQMNLMDMHAIRGYADARASAGRGALWSFHIPFLLWSRGMAFGAIRTYPGNPGSSYLIDADYLLKNANLMAVERVG